MSKVCLHCGEPVLPHETIPAAEGKMHRECLLRTIAGSVAHQQRRCLCFGGTGHDDPDLSRRENARRAAKYFAVMQDKINKARFN